MTGSTGETDRGVSDAAGVAVLLLVTVAVTASVGLGVLTDDGTDDSFDAEFEFDHLENSEALLVTRSGGSEELRAGDLYVDGPENNVSWAALSELGPADNVSQGQVVQVRESNAYGSAVGEDDTVEVVYAPPANESGVVARWN